MEFGTPDTSSPYERVFEDDSYFLGRKYLGKLPAVKTVCMIALVFVSIAAGVSIIFTIKCAVAFPEMKAKLNKQSDNKTATVVMEAKLNELRESNKIRVSNMEAKLYQFLDEKDQSVTDLYMKISMLMNNFESFCYKLFKNRHVTWDDAKKQCEHIDGSFAETRDNDTKNVVHSMVPRQEHVWLGARQDTKEVWKWVTSNTKVDLDDPTWEHGEPNNKHEQCLELIDRPGGLSWNDIDCKGRRYYICQKQKEGDSCDAGWS